jgi:hypothetical protein
MSEAASLVRSRIESTISKSASFAAASSSSSNASAKKTTSARANGADQSVLPRATPCQSSRTATLVIFFPSMQVLVPDFCG